MVSQFNLSNMASLRLALGSDHAGFQIKQQLLPFLKSLGHTVKDFGTFSDTSIDYPDVARPIAESVANAEFDFGILVCGSGNGVSITANKVKGVRSALCWLPEIAALARAHNNANVCSVPGRYVTIEVAQEIVTSFLGTEFEGGRHSTRVSKIEPSC